MEHKFFQPNKKSWFNEVSVNKSEQSWNVKFPKTIKNSFLLFKSFLKLYFKTLIFFIPFFEQLCFLKFIDFTEQIDWLNIDNK